MLPAVATTASPFPEPQPFELLSGLGWGELEAALGELFHKLQKSWDEAAVLDGLWQFLGESFAKVGDLMFVVALPLSLPAALASLLTVALLSFNRPNAPRPFFLPYAIRNLCHSFLLVLLGGFFMLLCIVLLMVSIFPSGHPDPAILTVPTLVLLLLYPLLFLAFAVWGMHFSKKRTLLGLLLFTLLSAALFGFSFFWVIPHLP